jgi:hypothetical protein
MYLNVLPMTLAIGGSGGKAWERGMPSLTQRISLPRDT